MIVSAYTSITFKPQYLSPKGCWQLLAAPPLLAAPWHLPKARQHGWRRNESPGAEIDCEMRRAAGRLVAQSAGRLVAQLQSGGSGPRLSPLIVAPGRQTRTGSGPAGRRVPPPLMDRRGHPCGSRCATGSLVKRGPGRDRWRGRRRTTETQRPHKSRVAALSQTRTSRTRDRARTAFVLDGSSIFCRQF